MAYLRKTIDQMSEDEFQSSMHLQLRKRGKIGKALQISEKYKKHHKKTRKKQSRKKRVRKR